MRHVVHPSTQQQVIALGQLGWSLRRIEAETGIRREAISGYPRAAGVDVRRICGVDQRPDWRCPPRRSSSRFLQGGGNALGGAAACRLAGNS